MTVSRRGLLLVISSPSGAGKTSITRALLAQDDNLHLSISATTRPARPGERHDFDYLFISQDDFNQKIKADDMLEHATVFGHSYGTPRKPIEQSLQAGQDVLLDIDWQGADQLREKIPHDLISIFLLPPSARELYRRLCDRQQDPDEVIINRMRLAGHEMSHWHKYDYVLINDHFETTLAATINILKVGRQERARQINLPKFVETLQKDISHLPLGKTEA